LDHQGPHRWFVFPFGNPWFFCFVWLGGGVFVGFFLCFVWGGFNQLGGATTWGWTLQKPPRGGPRVGVTLTTKLPFFLGFLVGGVGGRFLWSHISNPNPTFGGGVLVWAGLGYFIWDTPPPFCQTPCSGWGWCGGVVGVFLGVLGGNARVCL